MNKGTYESTKWVDTVVYKYDLPTFAQRIYDFWMYRKIVNTCSDQTLYDLHALSERIGLTKALRTTITNVKVWRSQQDYAKRHYVEDILNAPKVTVESFKDQLEEEDRIAILSVEQRKLRDAMWLGNGEIPRSVFTSQPVIYSYEDENGVGYRIYEKIYWFYSAIVYSPMNPEGTLLKHHDWKDQWGLQYHVDTYYKAEKERYRKYRIGGNTDSISRKVSPNKQKGGYTPDIDKVRRNLGLDGNDDQNLNGDIF